jgi:hypothetical protein
MQNLINVLAGCHRQQRITAADYAKYGESGIR